VTARTTGSSLSPGSSHVIRNTVRTKTIASALSHRARVGRGGTASRDDTVQLGEWEETAGDGTGTNMA
jgi:hypothetical protein